MPCACPKLAQLVELPALQALKERRKGLDLGGGWQVSPARGGSLGGLSVSDGHKPRHQQKHAPEYWIALQALGDTPAGAGLKGADGVPSSSAAHPDGPWANGLARRHWPPVVRQPGPGSGRSCNGATVAPGADSCFGCRFCNPGWGWRRFDRNAGGPPASASYLASACRAGHGHLQWAQPGKPETTPVPAGGGARRLNAMGFKQRRRRSGEGTLERQTWIAAGRSGRRVLGLKPRQVEDQPPGAGCR